MSSGLMDDHRERRQAELIASHIGISVDELNQLQWKLHPIEGHDDATYGEDLYFSKGSDPNILRKIKGLQNNEWVRLGFLLEETDDPEPDDAE